jgi:hypothetical protein
VLDYYAGLLDAIESFLDHKSALIRAFQADYEEGTRYNLMEAIARYFNSRKILLSTAFQIMMCFSIELLGLITLYKLSNFRINYRGDT